MTARVVPAVIALALLCAACSNEFVVLEPRQSTPDPVVDSGLEDAQLADAHDANDASVPTEDAASPVDAAAPDSAVGAYAVSGFAQTCALRAGALYCWGADDFGQLGIVGDSNRNTPVRVGSDSFIDVCAGQHHSCALRNDGSALCWGSNAHGELGVGDLNSREQPATVNAGPFVAIRCGGYSTCALTERGQLWCWGENIEGKLAQGDPPETEPGTLTASTTPVQIKSDSLFLEVSVGQGHVCARSEQGRVYCWGRNNYGQLGISEQLAQTRTPLAVAGDTRFQSIAAGQSHSCAVDVAGKLWCWGKTEDGLLGIQSTEPVLRVPTLVAGEGYALVTANWLHSCALKQDGTLFCWGRGEEGQLGGGDSGKREAPTQVGRDGHWRTVNAGQFHTCAFANDSLYCWGANNTGQLGLGDNERHYVPLMVQLP